MNAAATESPPLVRLAALLAGLGAHAEEVAADLAWPAAAGPAPTPGAGRTCVDAGAGAVLAVRAPGRRRFDVQVRRRPAAPPDGAELWDGLVAGSAGGVRRWSRTVWPGRPGGPAPEPDRLSGVLSASGRVWSVERDAAGRTTAVSWQLDRHAAVAEVLERAGVGGCWAPAAAAFDRLHGFAVSATAGPWSVSRRHHAPGGAPLIRLGTTRWAWSVDDAGKRRRLAEWISAFGGDGAYAAALYDLLVGARTGRPLPVGRAVELDLAGEAIVAVAAYLVALPPAAVPAVPRPSLAERSLR
jgi:YD repeat-containing protein